MMKTRWLHMVMLTALSLAAGSCGLSPKEVRVVLGKHELCIPVENLRSHELPAWLKSATGLPPSKAILLIVGAEEVARHVEGYVPYYGDIPDNLLFSVESVDEKSRRWLLNPEMRVYSDAWYGRGLLDNRVVEPHASGFYKVRQAGIYSFWDALTIYPDSTQPAPTDPHSWFLAGCWGVTTASTEPGTQVNCLSKFVHEDLLFHVYLNEESLAVVEDVRAFVLQRVLSWKVADRV